MSREVKLYCRKHKKKTYPYFVCAHIVHDGAQVHIHVPPERDGDDRPSGQLLCSKKHWPMAPGDKEPIIMCALCAEQFLVMS